MKRSTYHCTPFVLIRSTWYLIDFRENRSIERHEVRFVVRLLFHSGGPRMVNNISSEREWMSLSMLVNSTSLPMNKSFSVYYNSYYFFSKVVCGLVFFLVRYIDNKSRIYILFVLMTVFTYSNLSFLPIRLLISIQRR